MEPEPEPFCVRGYMKNGQVVLNVALPLPDVATEPPDEVTPICPPGPMPEQEIKNFLLVLEHIRAKRHGGP